VRKIRCLFLFLIVLGVAHLFAEEIALKDGTKVTGKLTAINGDTFLITTAYGEIKVPRSEIVSISFAASQPKSAENDEAAAAVEESLVGATYTNRSAKFQTTIPAGWKLAPEMRKTKDIVAALKSPDETLFFLVTPESFAGTLATYKVLAETQYKTKFSDYAKLSEADATLDGRGGIRMVFEGKPDKATPMKCLVYILPYDGKMVRLSFLTLEPLFNDAVPVFEQIAMSYKSLGAGDTGQK